MARRKKYKVGDRVFFEYHDGSVGTDIVLEVHPESYVDDNDKIDWQCKKCGKIDWDNEYIHN